MCLLSYYPPGVMPVREHLENGARLNAAGCGYALAAGGTLAVGHGLDSAEMISWFLDLRAALPDGPAMFHSRYAQTGAARLESCHPMNVGGSPGTVVAHNGYLFTSPDGRTDTRVLADDELPRFSLGDPAERFALAVLMEGNKAVIMSAGKDAIILNERLGSWVSGAWHSSPDYGGGLRITGGECSVCHCGSPVPVCKDCEAAAEPRRRALLGLS
jgi:glutamine amidotransferase